MFIFAGWMFWVRPRPCFGFPLSPPALLPLRCLILPQDQPPPWCLPWWLLSPCASCPGRYELMITAEASQTWLIHYITQAGLLRICAVLTPNAQHWGVHLPQLTFLSLLPVRSVFVAAHGEWCSGSQVFNHNVSSGSCICETHSSAGRTLLWRKRRPDTMVSVEAKLPQLVTKTAGLFCSYREGVSISLPIKDVAICYSSSQYH